MLGVLVIFMLIALSAFFVLAEFSLVKMRASRVEVLARKGNARAVQVQEIQKRMDVYLAAIQVGITLIGLLLGWVGEPALAHRMRHLLSPLALPSRIIDGLAFASALSLLAFVQIVFGELLPRFIALQKAESIALWIGYPLRLFTLAFRLPVALMHSCSTFMLRLMGMSSPSGDAEPAVSEEEMRILLGETQEKGVLPLERLLLLENLFDFGSAKAGEAMVPLEKAAYLSLKKPWAENLETIRSRRFSRYPLCEGGLESVIGMIHVKDLILKGEDGRPPDLRHLRRDMAAVLESDPLEKIIKLFPDKGIHMAMVHDAAGRPSGLLTLEDLVEEIIGEVHDEFDLPQAWSLMDVIVPSCVSVGLAAADRSEAIAQMLSKLKASAPELMEEEVRKMVLDREAKFSSAVGRGVAVPHARLPSLSRPMVAVGRFAKPVPFPTPDTVPVRLIFLILTPASAPIVQLKILSRIASLATNENLRRRLFRAKTAESMLDTLRTADTLLAA